MINTKDSNLYKIFSGNNNIRIAYADNSLVHANGLLITFDWKYIESFTINGEEYTLPSIGVVFPKKTKIVWSAKPLKYCHLDISDGEFLLEDHIILGTTGGIDKLPLNVVLYNDKINDFLFTNILTDEIENLYKPVGIEIIPSSHDVYKNGMSGIASIEGQSGVFDDNHNAWSWATERKLVGGSKTVNTLKSKIDTSNGDTYFPSNIESILNETFVEGINENDYYYYKDSSQNYAPSPYNQDGSMNQIYISTSNSNVLQYFDGKKQTSDIYSHVGDKSTIVKKTLEYKTPGTNIGDWYVPSTGEFGYMVVKAQDYFDICNILKSIYPQLNLISGNLYGTSNYWGFRNDSTGYQIARFTMDRAYHTKSSLDEFLNVIPFCNLYPDSIKTITLDWCGVKKYIINDIEYDDRISIQTLSFSKNSLITWSAEILSDNYNSETTSGSFILDKNMTISINPTEIKTEMPVVMVNKKTHEIFYTNYFFTYPQDIFEPIGVVVIPQSHNVYGDKSVGIVALKYISLTTPNEGSIELNTIPFGGDGHVSTDIKTYVPIYENNTHSSVKMVDANTTNRVYFPIQQLPTLEVYFECVNDTKAGYTQDSYTSQRMIPSPYMPNDERNEMYFTPNDDNILNYFDGKEKCEEILKECTSQPNWKTDQTILQNTNKNSFPIVCASWRYQTIGTKQGDWFVPSSGESGYMCARRMFIGYTLESIKHFFEMNIITHIDSLTTCDAVSSTSNFDIGFVSGRFNPSDNTKSQSSNIPFTKMRIFEKGEF